MSEQNKAQAVNQQKETELDGNAEMDGKGATRRRLLRTMMWGSVLFFFAEAAGAAGLMFWPRKVTGFGAKITAGSIEDFPPDSVTIVREGKFFISHVTGTDPDTNENYGGQGIIALYWKCPHLGCTVPWAPSGDPDGIRHFHCPCHGSQFNRVGERTGGPTPRPMDYMELTIENGQVIVDTGKIIEREAYDPSQLTQI